MSEQIIAHPWNRSRQEHSVSLAGPGCGWCGDRPQKLLTPRGLATYYVLFFIHLESRRVDIAGINRSPPMSRG